MQQFIPFEDDWDALEKMDPVTLIPYRVGLVPVHEAGRLREEPAGQAPACLSDGMNLPAPAAPSP